jgi:hypothetical protein
MSDTGIVCASPPVGCGKAAPERDSRMLVQLDTQRANMLNSGPIMIFLHKHDCLPRALLGGYVKHMSMRQLTEIAAAASTALEDASASSNAAAAVAPAAPSKQSAATPVQRKDKFRLVVTPSETESHTVQGRQSTSAGCAARALEREARHLF